MGNLRRAWALGRDAGNAIKNVGAVQGAGKQPGAIDHRHRQAWFEQARHFHQLGAGRHADKLCRQPLQGIGPPANGQQRGRIEHTDHLAEAVEDKGAGAVIADDAGIALDQQGAGGLHDRAGIEQPRTVDIPGEGGDIVTAGVHDDFLGRAFAHHLAVGHDRNPGAELQGFLEVMGDEQDGFLQGALQAQQLVLHLRANQRVEGAEGFVHDQHIGVGGQCPGQADPLAHATGELMGMMIGPFGQADDGQHFFGALTPFGRGDSAQLETELGVLDHGFVRQQREVLEDHGDARPADLP